MYKRSQGAAALVSRALPNCDKRIKKKHMYIKMRINSQRLE
jgi:hypothetical protein